MVRPWPVLVDGSAHGPYRDSYIITNIARGILNGWYDERSSGWFPMVGFKLGMLHGGFLCQPGNTLVTLTDPDFTKGYHVGRDYAFTEAPLENRCFSDTLFNDNLHEWAHGYREWREPSEVLYYVLGCRIGELSAAIIPALIAAPIL